MTSPMHFYLPAERGSILSPSHPSAVECFCSGASRAEGSTTRRWIAVIRIRQHSAARRLVLVGQLGPGMRPRRGTFALGFGLLVLLIGHARQRVGLTDVPRGSGRAICRGLTEQAAEEQTSCGTLFKQVLAQASEPVKRPSCWGARDSISALILRSILRSIVRCDASQDGRETTD